MIPSADSEVAQRYLDTRRAFDSVAGQYRGPLGNNRLVQHMRESLWRTLANLVPSRARLLDLGCGTGIDALHFVDGGYAVTAIDGSEQMVMQTRLAAQRAQCSERLTVAHMGIQDLDRLSGTRFDCIYSDLGALNCVADLEAVSRSCAKFLEPRGLLIFSIIGRCCPWELAYFLLRGNLARARVRYAREQVSVKLNGGTVWTRYYSPRQFYRLFAPQFELRGYRALNLFLPPPYLIGHYERHPNLFQPLAWLDERLSPAPGFRRAGDHFLMVMSRREEPTP